MDSLVFREFEPGDLTAYQAWFDDPELARRLSFPDETWLCYLEEPHVAGWKVASQDSRGLAMVQVDRDENGVGYSDVAVKPQLRSKGLRRRILKSFIAGPGICYRALHATVEPDNEASIRMLRRCGFRQTKEPDADGFLEFILEVRTRSRPGP